MAIRVTQRNMYGSMINNMQNSLAAYMESVMQGSTQKRINRPSDDPGKLVEEDRTMVWKLTAVRDIVALKES